MRFLNSGHETDVFVVGHRRFGENIVMKMSSDHCPDGPVIWRNKQAFAKNKISNVLNSLPERPYKIPKIFAIYKQHSYEEFMTGEILDRELWDDLSKVEQENILYAWAIFLHDLHHEIPPVSTAGYFSASPRLPLSFDSALIRLRGHLPAGQYDLFSNRMQSLKSYESAGSPTFAMTYGDFRPANMLYDRNIGRLSFFDLANCQWGQIDGDDMGTFRKDDKSYHNIILNPAERHLLLEIYNGFVHKNIGTGEPDEVKELFDWLDYIYYNMGDLIGHISEPGVLEFYKNRFQNAEQKILKISLCNTK